MRILGIDCGTAITGWSIVDVPIGQQSSRQGVPKLIELGIVETHKLTPEQYRLQELGIGIRELIAEFKPQQIAVEDIFFFKNAKTVIKVSQARGVVIYEAMLAGLEYFSYTPPQVKQALTGYGRAEKTQIMSMLKVIFKLNVERLQDDAADAVAIAYCHWLTLK